MNKVLHRDVDGIGGVACGCDDTIYATYNIENVDFTHHILCDNCWDNHYEVILQW